jgi:hypothetical protein
MDTARIVLVYREDSAGTGVWTWGRIDEALVWVSAGEVLDEVWEDGGAGSSVFCLCRRGRDEGEEKCRDEENEKLVERHGGMMPGNIEGFQCIWQIEDAMVE